MTTAADYRQRAIDCMEAARKATSEAERDRLLDLASEMLHAATLASGQLPAPAIEDFIGQKTAPHAQEQSTYPSFSSST